MPVRTIHNQYRGINAHLHSYLQAEGGWSAFHTAHIADLNKTLKAALLPMGYTTDLEPSVQIRRLDEPIGQPESDVAVYDLDADRAAPPSRSPVGGELVMPVADLIAESPLSEKQYRAVGIYEIIPEKRQAGQLVAWLELLSPSNKGSREDARIYREKRLHLPHGGIVFIELDYLHETPPTFAVLPNYRGDNPNAHPYRIVVIDPRPDFEQGRGYVHSFQTDEPLPTVAIPLNGEDVLHFDFGVPYQKTFEEMLYGMETVDYGQLPLNFRRYSSADQLRILRRMLTVLGAARQGENLDEPLPLRVPLESVAEGLSLLERET